MASLRRFDVQAKVAVVLSLAALAPLVATALLTLRNYDNDLRAIQYGEQGKFKLLFLAGIGLTMMLSVGGIALGFNSAGQRRNKDQGKSWAGFFIGFGALSLALILFSAFRTLGFEIKA